MEAQLREGFYLLQRIWGGRVEMKPTEPIDHFYTDGTACGSFCRLTFYESTGGYVTTAYLFPNGSWVCLGHSGRLEHTMGTWVQQVRTLFDPAVARAAAEAKAAAIKEELVAEAFKPSRVEAALAAGVDVDQM